MDKLVSRSTRWLSGRTHGPFAVAVLCLVLATCVSIISPAEARLEVRDLRVGVHPDKTRLVIDLSERADYRIFLLADPYRIVIDLPEAEFRTRASRKSRGGVNGYRFGLYRPGTSRVVIDTQGPLAVVKSFQLPPDARYGNRLVIDLRKVDRARFLREAAASVRKRQAPAAVQITRPATSSKTKSPNIVIPKSRQATAAISPTLPTPRVARSKRVVVIDPGHGGVDPGTIGASGVYEKGIVLGVARALGRALEATGRYRVVLTRNRDIFVRLRQRFAVAQDVGADLFISLHADSIENSKLRGASVYTLSETASDKEAATLATHINAGDTIAGVSFEDKPPEVARFLIDLAQRDTMNQSARFAQMLVGEMRGRVRMLGRPHRFAGFAVLKAPDVPSVLIELGFLSNRNDEKLLRSAKHHQSVAQAISGGIDRYFREVRQADARQR